MIEIGRLRLQLPAGFEHRGEPIARLLGQALRQHQVTESRRLDQLSVGPLPIDPSQSNASVAQEIAQAVRRQLGQRGE